MKKFDSRKAFQIGLAVLIMGGATIWAILDKSEGETDLECTTEYVQQFGEKDCQNVMSGNEFESDSIRDSLVP